MRSEKLEGCHGTGGPLSSTASYQVRVPVDRQPPFTLAVPMDFTVEPGRYDRFTVTLGPDDELDTPWIGAVDLRVRSDSGGGATIGPFGLVDPGGGTHVLRGTSWEIEPTDDDACMRRNARRVSGLLETPDLTAPEALSTLERALRR